MLRTWKKAFDVILEELHISFKVMPTPWRIGRLEWLHISYLDKSEYIVFYIPNKPETFFTNPDLPNVLFWQSESYKLWQLHSLTTRDCERYIVWQLHSVTVTPCESYKPWLLHRVTATHCDSYTVWQLHSVTPTEWDIYSFWQLQSVTATQFPIQHSVNYLHE